MNSDIRIAVDFFDHPKTIKLQRQLGLEGVVCLLKLWAFAGKHKPSGHLSGMDEEEISLAAKWPNDPITFVQALVNVRYLDVNESFNDVSNESATGGEDEECKYRLHNWVGRNGYASSANDRSDKSRFSRMAKTHKALYEELKAQGYEAITAEQFKTLTAPRRVPLNESLNDRSTNVKRNGNDPLTNPVSPSPLPSPSPSIIGEEPSSIPYQQIFDAYNKFCPDLPKVHSPTPMRQLLVKAAWEKYQTHEGGPLRVFDTVFKKAQASDYLTHRKRGYDGNFFKAKFDWLFDETKMVAVLEGTYDNDTPVAVPDNPSRPKRGAELVTREAIEAARLRIETEDISESF